MEVQAIADATAGSSDYNTAAEETTSAWVGSSAQPSGPVAVQADDAAPAVMTVTPDQQDLSADEPAIPDGGAMGTQDPAQAPATDSYGYQAEDGPVNDGYSPYVAADGTDLSSVTATGKPSGTPPICKDSAGNWAFNVRTYEAELWKKHLGTVVGEDHINWDGTGRITYETGAETTVSVMAAGDSDHFMWYIKTKHIWFIPNGKWEPGTAPPVGSIICQRRYNIEPDGLDGSSQQILNWPAPGSTVEQQMWSSDDGITGYNRYLPRSKRYRERYGPGGIYSVTQGSCGIRPAKR